jgi:dTDP-4-amino-4,6-dideoxygalactose transaminase
MDKATSRPPIPAFSLTRQIARLRPELDAAWDRVVRSGQFILGPEVEALEREVAARLGPDVGAVGVASGSDALYLILLALGVGPGDEVVTTPFTFFATAGAVVRTGAVPVFADVEPDTFNLDPDEALARVTPRTRVILPVHLFGLPADVAALRRGFAGAVVEDAAQALGAAVAGRPAGTWGEAAAVSFFPTKNLGAFGDGGLVVSRDAALLDRVRRLRVHGARTKYFHEEVGVNSRLDALQAAVLRVKLGYLDAWTARRRALAARYREGLAARGLSEVVVAQAEPPGRLHAYHQFTVRVPDREGLRRYLAAQGIGTAVYYPYPLHRLPAFAQLGYGPGAFPVAERLAAEVLSLPLFPELEEEEVDRVVDAVAAYYRGAA